MDSKDFFSPAFLLYFLLKGEDKRDILQFNFSPIRNSKKLTIIYLSFELCRADC